MVTRIPDDTLPSASSISIDHHLVCLPPLLVPLFGTVGTDAPLKELRAPLVRGCAGLKGSDVMMLSSGRKCGVKHIDWWS